MLFTKMKIITRNRLLNLLQIHLLHHVGLDLHQHSCVDLPLLAAYSMGHPLKHDQSHHVHRLFSGLVVLGIRGALEEYKHSYNDLTGQEGTHTVQVLLGWDQHQHLPSHGLTQASMSFPGTETCIKLIGWGQECIIIEHRAILDRMCINIMKREN